MPTADETLHALSIRTNQSLPLKRARPPVCMDLLGGVPSVASTVDLTRGTMLQHHHDARHNDY